jgi:20S proteasome alpha/beta subunit
VTIIVGLVCRNSIVLANDSQQSRGDSKEMTKFKIRAVEFKGGVDKILVAQAGTAETSTAIINNMVKLASCQSMGDEAHVRALVRQAIRQEMQRLREHNLNCSLEELSRLIFSHGLNCTLMTAFYAGGRAFLDTYDFQTGLERERERWFRCIGIGETLANYILSELSEPDMDDRLGRTLAVHIIDKVIQNVRDCFEPIRVATIAPKAESCYEGEKLPDGLVILPGGFIDPVVFYSREAIDEIKQAVRAIDAETKKRTAPGFRSRMLCYAKTLPHNVAI